MQNPEFPLFHPNRIATLSLSTMSQVWDMNVALTRSILQTHAHAAAAMGLTQWAAWLEGMEQSVGPSALASKEWMAAIRRTGEAVGEQARRGRESFLSAVQDNLVHSSETLRDQAQAAGHELRRTVVVGEEWAQAAATGTVPER